ncbi:MAG: hypothetical protein JW735_00585, partial [Prolixibacteraceae bacterium]|nr:hypothetical protein [Prolixibacteraceae bacterium]
MERERIKTIYWPLVLFLATAMLFTACGEDNNDDDITPKFLVDNEAFSPAIPATVDNIKGIMNTAGVNALT